MATSQTNDYLLYEPDEALGPLISLGHGLLSVVGRLIGMAATTAIVVQASDQPSEYLPWLYSASLVVCGLGTIAQAFQFGRFGSGYAIGVVSSSAFIAMAIAALTAGGPALLSSVMVVSAILLFVFIQRLSLLRRFIFTLLMNLTGPRARRLETDLHVSSLPKIDAFCARSPRALTGTSPPPSGCARPARRPCRACSRSTPSKPPMPRRNLIISARGADSRIELEFVATSAGMDENLEDRLAYLGGQMQIEDDRERSFRLLRHYASSVQHRKYHEIDVVTVQVDARRSA